MISTKMQGALNKQIELEAYASNLYLAMAAWCDQQGLAGCTQFMRRQSDEERDHMLRIVDYLFTVDGKVIIPALKKPPNVFKSVKDMFEMVYSHEQKVTQSIFKLLELSDVEKDYSAENFLQWYVEEQREEEELMRNILDKLKLIGSGARSLYYIDLELEKINQEQLAAAAAEIEA